MDHNQALQLQAAVKYVLGELSQVQRDEYEEHYFDCAECAVDIKALATFADTTREVLRQERANEFARELVPARAGWLRWLRPVFTAPAFAALLLIVAYQNTVTIPQAREEASTGVAQIFVTSRTAKMAVVRGGDELTKFSVRPNESLPLRVPGSFTNKELNVVIPTNRVKQGKYTLVFTADPGAKGQPTKDEVLRLSFAIEFLP